jgi:hypothetical protein
MSQVSFGDLAGPQPGFDRQQHDQLVTNRVASIEAKIRRQFN